jgi:hypothetical protein
VSSNVGQNYPYTSESEADRMTSVSAVVEAHPELADKIAAETTPLEADSRWWVWKCPTKGCRGLLHAAGYSLEKHAVYVVCDGTCARTFLH